MDLFRRISALTLVLTLSLIGVPLPAHAADGLLVEITRSSVFYGSRRLRDESPPHRRSNGLPLSRFLNRTATGDPLVGLLGQETGQISGVLLDEDGQPLADRRVELDRPSSEGQGRLAVTTDTNGTFLYSRCPGFQPWEVLRRPGH